MRINDKRGFLYLRELYETNPEFINKKFYLEKAKYGRVIISTNEIGSIELKKTKISQSDNCIALTDKLLIKYMLKYSKVYRYVVIDENKIMLIPKLTNKKTGEKKNA